jgi:hypothetical protein
VSAVYFFLYSTGMNIVQQMEALVTAQQMEALALQVVELERRCAAAEHRAAEAEQRNKEVEEEIRRESINVWDAVFGWRIGMEEFGKKK